MSLDSISQIKFTEDKLFFKSQNDSVELADRIYEKKYELVLQKAEKLSQIGGLLAKIERLSLLKTFMDPDEIDRACLLLEKEIEGEKDLKISKSANKKFEDLVFSLRFPIADELDKNYLNSNFISRLGLLRQWLELQQFLIFFKAWYT